MLTRTFLHLPGIGKASEAKLKACGLNCWDDALAADETALRLPLKKPLCFDFRAGLQESAKRLAEEDALWFSERLSGSEQWRLYPHFRQQAAYVDIETTGLAWPGGQITSIALYDGRELKVYVQGRNLDDFVRDITDYRLLITWNGRAFDAPFLRRSFGIELRMAHLDLFPVFRALGIKGGLKKVEKQLGLNRDELDGVDGYMAILLWNEYQRTGNENALETLLAYNAEDVLSLETLSLHACAMHGVRLEPEGQKPQNPFRADAKLLERLKDSLTAGYGQR